MDKKAVCVYAISLFLLFIVVIVVGIYPYFLTIKTRPIIQPKPPPPYAYLIPIVQSKQPKLDPITATEIAKSIYQNSKKYQFPPELIIALIEQESSFIPTSTSSAKCIGLMQINPKAHPKKIEGLKHYQLYYINNNIEIGCQILKEYYNATGVISEALEKYLGVNNKSYVLNILKNFTNSMIEKNSIENELFRKSEEKICYNKGKKEGMKE